MKIKGLNSVLKFLLTISVFSSFIGLFYFNAVMDDTKITSGQDLSNKKILIYEYNNIKNENLGYGKYKFTMEIAVPFKIYQKGDTLINESRYGSVKYRIAGKENYVGKANNGNWEDIFEINADSVVYELHTNFDVGIKGDTVLFRKDSSEVLSILEFMVFDKDEKEIKVNEVSLKDNKVTYKFNRTDKSKTVKVDPTWSWQPDATDGKDAGEWENGPDDNHGTDVYLICDSKTDNRIRNFIQFIGWRDNIGVSSVIDSAFLYLAEYGTRVGNLSFFVCPVDEYWEEMVVTWNNQPAHDSTLSFVSDTLTDSSAVGSHFWKFDIKNVLNSVIDGNVQDSGMVIRATIENTVGNNKVFWYSSDYATASERPKLVVEYRLNENLNLDVTALSDSSIEGTIDTSESGYVDSLVIMRSIDSSAMGDVFYSLKDTLDTLSINTKYSLIAGGYVGDTLKYYSDPDSIYTLVLIPDTPFVQSWTTTSLRIHPSKGENPADVKLAIYDSTLQKYLNSSGDTLSSAVWQTEAQWDTLVTIKRVPNTEYILGVFAKNEDDSITAISDLKSCKTNSTIDSIEVCAVTDSSYVIYFGGDSVYSPFEGYFAIDDSDSSTVSDTIDVFLYGIKSIFTNKPFSLNTLNRFRILRIENQADSLYYSDADSAYTLTAKPTQPVISGTSDSTFLLQFDDISGNPDTIKYAVFDSVYSLYRNTTGDTIETIVFAVDTLWDNVLMKTYTPNLFISVGIFGKNDDSVFSAVSFDTTWTWAAVPGTTMVGVIDSTRLLININPNGNPNYTYFAVEDSISRKFVDINTGRLRSSGVTVDSTWAFGRYSDWGGSEGFTIIVAPKTSYYFRAYSKDGNTNP